MNRSSPAPARRRRWIVALTTTAALLTACGGDGGGPDTGRGLSGEISINGSSTVYPISELMAYEFGRLHPGVRITVGVSGTGGGFAKWVRGETTINGASRPINEEERAAAAANGFEPIELAVAYDGLSIVVNKDNDWIRCVTLEQLHQIWSQDGAIDRWSDIDPSWPEEEIVLYGPGTDSGTFDYFNEVVIAAVSEQASHTPDYTASENDEVLVEGVAGDLYALGYFGYAFYIENRDKIRTVAVDGGSGCVEPTAETINNGSYAPLSRPLFIYVSSEAIARPEVTAFVRFYLEQAPELVARVGYVPLPPEQYKEGLARLADTP